MFSVYTAGDCPAFADAVVLAVARRRDGVRRAVAAQETGQFPEFALARAGKASVASGEDLELHVHLLARTAAERRSIVADLACDPVSRFESR